jgi:hypothetical protein
LHASPLRFNPAQLLCPGAKSAVLFVPGHGPGFFLLIFILPFYALFPLTPLFFKRFLPF